MKSMYLKSWMHHLSTVRNISGRHDRFYIRLMSIKPKLLSRDVEYRCNNEFPTLLIVKNIYELSWSGKWTIIRDELTDIIASHTDINLQPMGFSDDWINAMGLMRG